MGIAPPRLALESAVENDVIAELKESSKFVVTQTRATLSTREHVFVPESKESSKYVVKLNVR